MTKRPVGGPASRGAWVLRVLALLPALVLGTCARPTPVEVPVGVLVPLSGLQEATGEDLQRGLELAAEIINGERKLDLPLARTAGLPGLGGARIRLVVGDDSGSPERGAAEARRLLEEEHVVALVGAYNSNVTAAASDVAEAAGVPFLSPASTAPALTRRGLHWFFRTTADDAIFVGNFFTFLAQLRAQRSIAPASVALVYEDGLFGSSVAELERAAAGQAGLQVVADVAYPAQATDVTPQARQVRDSGAALVLQSSYERDALLFMRAYKALGYRPQGLLAMDAGFISPEFLPSLGADANDVLSREVWALDVGERKPVVAQLNALFRERFGRDMTGNSARTFTGLLVLADALNRARSTAPEALRQALLATDLSGDQLIMPWEGVRFDPATGQNTRASGIIVQVQDGAWHTVWPPELATREAVWPMAPWPP